MRPQNNQSRFELGGSKSRPIVRRATNNSAGRQVSRRAVAPLRGYSRTAPAKRTSAIKLPLRFKIVGSVAVLLLLLGNGAWSRHVSANELAAKQAYIARQAELKTLSQSFSTRVNELAEVAGVATSVSLISSEGQASVANINDAPFYAASIGKLITATTYLELVDGGTEKLSQSINGDTAKELIATMITDSNDAAWQGLNDYLGHEKLQDFASRHGLQHYNADANSITAVDTAKLLASLQQGTLLKSESANLLKDAMRDANFRDFIVTAATPKQTIYHKVGVEADLVHDAAIITEGDKWIVLVIMTDGKGEYQWSDRAALMRGIAQKASDSFLAAPAAKVL